MNLEMTSINGRLTVEINSMKGFSDKDIEKYSMAITLLETVINTQEFVNQVKEMKLTGLNGLARSELISMIFSGAEALRPEHDGKIDVDVVMYDENNNVVGYTNPSTVKTWLNNKFFKKYTHAEVACNLFHEWLHKLGFDHRSATDYTSIPYALGYLVREMIKDLQRGVKFTPLDVSSIPYEPVKLPPPPAKVWVCRRRFIFFKKCGWEYPNQGECHA